MDIKKISVELGLSEEDLVFALCTLLGELDIATCLSIVGVAIDKQAQQTGLDFDFIVDGLKECKKEVDKDLARRKHHHRHHHRHHSEKSAE